MSALCTVCARIRVVPFNLLLLLSMQMIDGRTYMVRTERYSMSPPVEGCGGRFEQASVSLILSPSMRTIILQQHALTLA